jgi:hypothetical protein
MLERKLEEEQEGPVAGGEDEEADDVLSQDSENYNDDYKIMVQNQKQNAGVEQDVAQNQEGQEEMAFVDNCTPASPQNDGNDNQNLKFEADDLAASIRDSINRDARQEERDEVASVYSELDQSMR